MKQDSPGIHMSNTSLQRTSDAVLDDNEIVGYGWGE